MSLWDFWFAIIIVVEVVVFVLVWISMFYDHLKQSREKFVIAGHNLINGNSN